MYISTEDLQISKPLTTLDFLEPNSVWPPVSERCRIKKYRDNKLLFERHQSEVFKDGMLELYDPVTGQSKLVDLNWFKRLSTLWADLLFGEVPTITDKTNKETAQYVEDLARRINLNGQGYKLQIDLSRYGDGVYKLYRDEEGVHFSVVPPYFWFPVVSLFDMERIEKHVLVFPQEKTLLVEIHERGRVEYRTYENKDSPSFAGSLGRLLEAREEDTGIDGFLVQSVSNLAVSGSVYGFDDYGDIAALVLEMETRLSQNSNILKRHSDPKMYGPRLEEYKDGETGRVYTRAGTYFPVDNKDDVIPGYITWDAKLDVSILQFNTLLEQFYMLSETSPSAFGNIKAGLAESGSALKRLMMAPLAKVNRTKLNIDRSLKELIRVAALLDSGKAVEPSIEWQDGLPNDRTEDTQNEAAAVSSSLSSKKSAIKRLFNLTDNEADAELRQIEDEAPNIVEPLLPLEPLNGSGAGGGDDNGAGEGS